MRSLCAETGWQRRAAEPLWWAWLPDHPFSKWRLNEIILGALALTLWRLAREQAPLTTTLWSNDSRDAWNQLAQWKRRAARMLQ